MWTWLKWFSRRPGQVEAEWGDEDGWETHPCKLPEPSLEQHLTMLGQVWRCFCGRRWQLKRITREYSTPDRDFVRYDEWIELMSGAPISDAEFESLLEDTDGTA